MLKTENTTSLSIEDNENNQRFVEAGFVEPTLKKAGIGIENFLQGKVILITGATGFLTKVFVEKILRSMPGVIRRKDKEDAKQRLKDEIVDIEIFKCVKQKYGEQYEEFMWSKLVGVVGDVGQSNLGMEEDLATEIANDVHIIVNGAADTKFDQRYDIALQVNAMGPCNLMDFAKKCRNLELFLHISTSTVKSSRKGRLMEEIECLSLRDGRGRQTSIMTEAMVLEKEMKLVSDYKKLVEHNVLTPKMKQLGSIRYECLGYSDPFSPGKRIWVAKYLWVYQGTGGNADLQAKRRNIGTPTKALGEMLIYKRRGEILAPLVITRTSGILSTYKEPFPGWIEGIKTVDPVILDYGKGKLTGFPLNPNFCQWLDMVVNGTLGAMAKHASMGKKADMSIYHLSSTSSNPIVLEDLFKFVYQHFKSRPYFSPSGRPVQVSEMTFFNSLPDFSAHLWTSSEAVQFSSKKMFEFIKFKEHAEYMATIYLPYAFHTDWLDDSKTRGLIGSMSEEEKKKFGCDAKSIEWKDYIVNVHIPGLRRHIWKEKGLSKM
ncbi:hypothetical protein V6N13_093085 [Hibiscus sabdariffa]